MRHTGLIAYLFRADDELLQLFISGCLSIIAHKFDHGFRYFIAEV